MRTIDLSTYPRRAHFDLFRALDYPHFNLTAPLDVTRFHAAVKAAGASFTIALVYLLSRSANRLPEFRRRVRGESLVEHDAVHPSHTVPVGDDLFAFTHIEYTDDYAQFAANARRAAQSAIANPTLQDEPGRDDWLFMTAIPWVAFTSISHPIHMHPADSIPRFAWGRFARSGRRLAMPLSVQVHHAVMDGLHVGRFYDLVQSGLDDTGWLSA
jgi:chloramphenicol O-acetyltransferase type A